jgi:hypothetical protein
MNLLCELLERSRGVDTPRSDTTKMSDLKLEN